MGTRLFVGNLSYHTTDETLQSLFAAYGAVKSANVITDRESGRSKGFAFVEMGTDAESQAATAGLNGASVDGRQITVAEARPRAEGGGGGDRRGGGGYGDRRGGGRGRDNW
jgi:RNA recognition motif-containing protein